MSSCFQYQISVRVRDDTCIDLIYNKNALDIFLLSMNSIYVARNLAEIIYFCSYLLLV